MEKSQRILYSLAATSEDDDLSQGALFTKEGTFDKQRSSFWRRHRNMLLVQVVLLVFYTLTWYLAVAKIRSQSLHGPDLIHSFRAIYLCRLFADIAALSCFDLHCRKPLID